MLPFPKDKTMEPSPETTPEQAHGNPVAKRTEEEKMAYAAGLAERRKQVTNFHQSKDGINGPNVDEAVMTEWKRLCSLPGRGANKTEHKSAFIDNFLKNGCNFKSEYFQKYERTYTEDVDDLEKCWVSKQKFMEVEGVFTPYRPPASPLPPEDC